MKTINLDLKIISTINKTDQEKTELANERTGETSNVQKDSYVSDINVCDGIVCDGICDSVICDEATCDTVCENICDNVCDNIW